MENNDQNEVEISSLKITRNIHVSGMFLGSIVSGFDFAMAVRKDNPILYSVIGTCMVGYTVYHTLKVSEYTTEINNVKKNIKK